MSNENSLLSILADMGAAGRRANQIDAVEASAGNISVYMADADLGEVDEIFPCTEDMELPSKAPSLAGGCVVATGSGTRLRDVGDDPEPCVGVVEIAPGGATGTLHFSERRDYENLTSELNSHLAVHEDQVGRRQLTRHALVHAQPPFLTLLSHIPAYREQIAFNRAVLRWEPESIVMLPEGIGVLPFIVPGSHELMQANVKGLRDFQIVLWSKHGVMARSDISPTKAVDRIEYAEAGARYEYLNTTIGGRAEGLTDAEMHAVIRGFDVQTTIF
jgi:rhamnulose-1-phosphate aldolase